MELGLNTGNKTIKIILAAIINIILFSLIGIALWSYLDAFFLAVCSYMLLKPFYSFMRRKGFGKTFSGVSSVIVGIIIFGIPLVLASNLLIGELLDFINQTNVSQLSESVTSSLNAIMAHIPGFNWDSDNILNNKAVTDFIMWLINYLRELLMGILDNLSHLMLGLLIVIFTLYYLLVGEADLVKFGRAIIPFNKKNTEALIKGFRNVTYYMIVCTGLVALIQAAPLTLVYMYYGIPGAIFLGFISLILACIPFLGVPIIWIPLALLEYFQGNHEAALVITLVGIAVFIIDNMRAVMQKGIGQIHPLISVLGVVVGIVYFGVLGILIGPIVIYIAVLTAKMFKEEYV